MASRNHGLKQQHPNTSDDNTSTPSAPLKKRRSLARLFTPRSRKASLSRSQPPSPRTPETPKIPDQFLPTYPDTPQASLAQTSPNNREHKGVQSHEPSDGIESAQSERTSRQDGLGNPPAPTQSNPVSNASTISQDSHSDPYATNSALKEQQSLTGARDTGARRLSSSLRTSAIQLSRNKMPSRPVTAAATLSGPSDDVWSHHFLDNLPDGSSTILPHTSWQQPRNVEEIRTSVRSALTNNSSLANPPSTEGSSVLTRRTSVSELTVEIYEKGHRQETGMTVDDAISMYVAGFEDEVDAEETSPTHTHASDEERRRSMKIAEAINDSMGSELLPSKRPSISTSRSSVDITNDAALNHDMPVVPMTLNPTSARDQYGFLKASLHISFSQYEAWHLRYKPTQDRRTKKWLSYMRECKLATNNPSHFPPRSAKVQRYIRKGIPPGWRGAAWFFYSGGDALLQKHPSLYNSLVTRSSFELNHEDKEIIERDLNRTFPDNIHFKSDPSATTEQPLLASLRNVLRAFALHCPHIGYCQSLNFIAGLLLLFLPEEKTFCMLQIITTSHLPGTHAINLEGANIDLWVLMMALKDSVPGIWSMISSSDEELDSAGIKLPPISLCTTSWFMSLLIGTLPIESVLRVWDVLFYEGSRTLFRVAIAIFKLGEQRIKSVKESMELFQMVQSLPREMLDVRLLLTVALKRGGVSQEWVDQRRSERKQWYARERARMAGSPLSEDGDGPTAGMPKPRRAESMWRKRRK